MKKFFVLLSSLVLLSLLLTACGATPTAAPSTAKVDQSLLVQKGKLLVCSDLPYPPFEFFDENGNPAGLDVDMATEIGSRLGLQAQIINSVFDSIIEAVTGGKCDIIMSDMNITADRNKQISFIHYLDVGQSILVAKGNPKNINSPTDLCGQSVAAESGTTEVDYLQGTGDFKGAGLAADCTTAGKPAVTVVATQKDSDALQQLQAGKVVAYFADTPVAGQYAAKNPDQFQLIGQPIQPAPVGIGIPCGGAADCTNVPLTPLGQAIETALKSMMADGTYVKILTKYGAQQSAVTLP